MWEIVGNKCKLICVEKKQIVVVIWQVKGDGKVYIVQQIIFYFVMYLDGICKVVQWKYLKSIVFEDINYQFVQVDDKIVIFENWCDFFNYFDVSVNVQFFFIN